MAIIKDIKTRFKALLNNNFKVQAGDFSGDKFGRFRVSQLKSQFDLKQIHDERLLFMDFEQIGRGGKTYNNSTSSTTLDVSANLDASIAQSFQRFNYRSGKSQFVGWTTTNFQYETNSIKRIGYFSSSTTTPFSSSFDGFFLMSDSSGISLNVYRSGTLIEQVYQNDFNKDALDGYDWEQNTLIMCDFAWFGIDGIRWHIKNGEDVIHFHTSVFAGTSKGVYMRSGNQPFRAEIRGTGAASASFDYICATVASEGDIEEIGTELSDNLGTTKINANNTSNKYIVLAVDLQSAKIDTLVDIIGFSLMGTTNDDFLYEVWLNPTLSSGSLTFTSVSNSSVRIAKGTTGNPILSTGTLIRSGYAQQLTSLDKEINSAVKLGSSIAGVSDVIAVTVQPLSNGLDIYGALNWRELT